jgi:hypothetical protein
MATNANAAAICKRLGALKSDRQPHENVWRDCFDFTHPLRGDGFNATRMDAQQGAARQAKILDGTATDSSRMLASAIMSGLTPANSRWFELDVDNETEEERQWFDATADALWTNIHQANFDAEAYEACLDVVDAGWFALFIDEDRERGGLTFQQWDLSGCYVTSTRADGVIDTIYREHQLSAEAAVTKFGEDAVSEATAKLAKTKPDEKVQFVHAIYPRTPYVAGAKLAKNLPFASCVVEVKAAKLVREGGFREFPVAVPRWMRIPRSCYGVGPVFDALPDIRMLNELKGMELAAADLAIAGMWIAEDDGVLNPRTVKVGPRKVIVANSVESMKELKTSADFKLSEYLVTGLQAAIRKVLMSDQLQPHDGPAMTATEVHVRVQLIRQLLGPIYGRLQAEYLRPLVERCFGLAYRAGALGQAPRSLVNKEFAVKYVSPMARAQRLEEVTAIGQLVESVGALAAAKQDLSVFDLIDDAEATRQVGEGLGVPAGVLRSADDVAALRAQREKKTKDDQRQAAAQMAQQTMVEAAAKKAAA